MMEKIDITGFSQEELCEAYSVLNSWEWYDGFGNKPDGFDDMPQYRQTVKEKLFHRPARTDYIDPYFKAISDSVPEKELLRYHHIHNLGHTNEEFESWWYAKRKRITGGRELKGFWTSLKKNHPLEYEITQWMILAISLLAIVINIVKMVT